MDDTIEITLEVVENYCYDCKRDTMFMSSTFIAEDKCPICFPEYFKKNSRGILVRLAIPEEK